MKIIDKKITLTELQQMAKGGFGNLVKGVVDVDKEIMAVDAELHADEESLLLEKGSLQSALWGINLYPELYAKDDFVEFDSMINLRPNQNNMSRSVEDKQVREKIVKIVKRLVTNDAS